MLISLYFHLTSKCLMSVNYYNLSVFCNIHSDIMLVLKLSIDFIIGGKNELGKMTGP